MTQRLDVKDAAGNPDHPRPLSTVGVFVAVAILFALTAAAYFPGLTGPFFLDDNANLPQAQIGEVSFAELSQQFFAMNWPFPGSRGLSRVSFALTAFTSGLHPFAFKYQNLLLHLLNGLLIFWLLLVLFNERPGLNLPAGGPPVALAVTAFWLLHPLQVSSVLYAVQRLVLLSTFFTLAALLTYAKARVLARTRPRAGALVALLGVPLFLCLGLLSKETAALTPLLILLIEFFCFRFSFSSATGSTPRGVAMLLASIAVVPVIIGVGYFVLRFDSLIGTYAYREFTMPERLMTQLHVLALYLQLIMRPLPAHMSLFHDTFPVTRTLDWGTLALSMLYLAMILAALAARRRAPWFGLGILWYFCCHVMESSVIGLELVFEHRNYLALLGPALIIVLGLMTLFSNPRLSKYRLPVLAATLALLAFNTMARATVWGNWELMLLTEYEQSPHSTRVLSGLATLRFAEGDQAEGLRFLHALEAESTHEAAPFLGHLELQCRAAAVETDLLVAARVRLSEGLISPFTVNSLRALAERHLRGDCPALPTAALEQLFSAALGNPRLNRGMECPIRDAFARQQMQAQSWELAAVAVAATVDVCRRGSRHKPQTYDEALGNLIMFAQVNGNLAGMLELLSDLSETTDKTDITRGFPPWLDPEMITPAGIAQLYAEGR